MATTWFNESFYLSSKLAQLQKTEPTNTQWQGANALVNLQAALKAAGYTAESHFAAFGAAELTSPNKYFNADEYLIAKAAQQNKADGVATWTAQTIALAIKNAGMSVYQHFAKYGWTEGVNPSNSFDVTAYLNAKLAQMQKTDATYTLEQLKAALTAAGIDPAAHALTYATAEGVAVVPASSPVGGGSAGASNTFTLTVGQDTLTGTSSADTFKSNVVQNAMGQQVNTLGSGDVLEGGLGTDTLDAKITVGSFAGASGSTESMPIQPETNSIEYVKLQAVLASAATTTRDQVFVNAKDMVGVKTISSNYSDADLTIMNMTTKGSEKLQDLTVNMSYTGNKDSAWNASDFKVLFDQDYLTPLKSLGTASIDFRAMNEDGYDASAGKSPLEGVFFRQLQFTLNGQKFNLAALLGEDAAGAGAEIKTYDDFLASVKTALVALKAANPTNAALQSVQAAFGEKFTTDVNPTTLVMREGMSIRLTADGQTNGVANVMSVISTDLEVARAAAATVANNNRYERASSTLPPESTTLGINVELEKVGLAGDGGNLVIGSMNKGTDGNVWDTAKTVVTGTTNGINEFYVTVKGDASKSSSLASLRSTNNQLKTVTVKSADALGATSFADLTIGNSNSGITSATGYAPALKDVKTFDASAFKGNLDIKAALTNEVVAKYLNLKDVSPAAAAADNAAFVYTGGTGKNTIDLQVSSGNLAKLGAATREDMSVNIVGGANNDTITLSVVENGTSALDVGTTANWYVNQALNKNLRINAGDGDDTISKPGSGNVVIDAGAGNDTVYADNSAAKGAFVFNATNADLDNLLSDANTPYNLFKTSLKVAFKGFEATAAIADVNGKATDLEINQAIKKAINTDATLSKLLVAEDGPANTLVVKSLIDGVLVTTDLALSLVAPVVTAISTADAAQLATSWGVAVADGTAALTLINAQITAFGTKADYATKFGQIGAVNQTGAVSTHISDNTITGGAGNDVLVLGTGALDNDTLVYAAGAFGNDKIVNFTNSTAAAAAEAILAGTGLNADKLDFSAWLNSKVLTAGVETRDATAVVGAAAIGANDVAVVAFGAGGLGITTAGVTFDNVTDAQVLAALKVAGGVSVATTTTLVGNVQNSLVMVQNASNLGEYKVYQVTSDNVVGDNFTGATLVGSLDFGATQTFATADFA